MLWQETLGVHLAEHLRDMVGELRRNGYVAVAVGVEDGVKLDAVLAAPREVGVYQLPSLVRPRGHWAARRHARPGEEHFLDAA